MKILHIFNELKFSGAEIMYVSAAPIFKENNCQLSVLNTTDKLGEYSDNFKNAGYEVYHISYPFSRFKLLKRLKFCTKLIQHLHNNNYDIVHIHAHRLMFIVSMCSYIANVKVVYTFHSIFSSKITYPYHKLKRWIAKHLFKCKFQSISDSVYSFEKEIYNNETLKIYNWYNSYIFKEANNKLELRKFLDISSDTLVIISVGGCSHIKRHTDIIKSLQIIIKYKPNTLYLHLGEGNMLDEEMQLSQKLGVHNHIRYLGNKENVLDYLLVSDIYVMTSVHEGVPIATIEAMACGIPSILYNVLGLNNFNLKKECSLLIKEDYEELAHSIMSLSEDRDKQDTLRNNAKELVSSTYNVKYNTIKILEMYKSL